jgi:hypothetical protein
MTDSPTPVPVGAPAQLSDRLRAIRRVAIIVIIASLSITALIGIVTLLTGDFGDVQRKIMLTTLAIGLFSIVSLCDLAVAGRRFQRAGYLGILVSLVALVAALILIWTDFGSMQPEALWKTFGLTTIAGVSLAHANLLLLLGERRRSVVRIGLWVTVALIALLAVLLWLLILTNGDIGTDGYGRLVGTVAILDVLGTIVVPVVSKFLRDERMGASLVEAAVREAVPSVLPLTEPRPLMIQLPRELGERLTAAAIKSGRTEQDVAIAAIEKAVSAEQ